MRLITPGTITEDALLESARPNLLVALAQDAQGIGAAWLDVSTGLFETASLPPAELPALLGRLEPAEILAPATLALGDHEPRRGPGTAASPPLVSRRRLAEAFGAASLDAFGSFTDAEAVAAALALDYVRATQAGALPRLARPSPQGGTGVLAMDAATRASLEILRARDGGVLHTLISAVQRTAHGARRPPACRLVLRAADRSRRDRPPAGRLGLAARQSGRRPTACAPPFAPRPISPARSAGCR